jgi:hypothetical protein
VVFTRVADAHTFHPDPDPALKAEYRSGSNTDPIRIQGFNDQKLKKITAKKKLNFFGIKNYNLGTYPEASIKNVQVTEEAFNSQKRPYNTSKHNFVKSFSTFLGHFCPPGSGSNWDPDP